MINREILQLRKRITDRRPRFVRQESWRYDRLSESWRKPKGKDNKMRKQYSGVPALVKIGYRGPKVARGLHPSGYNDCLVSNAKDLLRLDSRKDAARLAHAIGGRKRIQILAKASEMGIKVLNPGKSPSPSQKKSKKTSSSRQDNAGSDEH